MTPGDRVWLVEDIEMHDRIVVGTIVRVSQAGYVMVDWDTDYHVSHFAPLTVNEKLKVVTGEDALPRHDWGEVRNDGQNATCLRCRVEQTDENELGPCEAGKASA